MMDEDGNNDELLSASARPLPGHPLLTLSTSTSTLATLSRYSAPYLPFFTLFSLQPPIAHAPAWTRRTLETGPAASLMD